MSRRGRANSLQDFLSAYHELTCIDPTNELLHERFIVSGQNRAEESFCRGERESRDFIREVSFMASALRDEIDYLRGMERENLLVRNYQEIIVPQFKLTVLYHIS